MLYGGRKKGALPGTKGRAEGNAARLLNRRSAGQEGCAATRGKKGNFRPGRGPGGRGGENTSYQKKNLLACPRRYPGPRSRKKH